MKKEYLKTIKLKNNYISEAKVINDNGDIVYVVTVLGNLLYATFNASYIDYVKGISDKKPNKIEGDEYLWFDCNQDRKETIYWNYYNETFIEASKKQHCDYINHKYSHLKKPLGKFKYEIIYKKTKPIFACGPVGDVYEIAFKLKNGPILYVFADDSCDMYSLYKDSVIDKIETRNDDYDEPIEEFEGFSKAKKSDYYDLYLEIEKYKDNF